MKFLKRMRGVLCGGHADGERGVGAGIRRAAGEKLDGAVCAGASPVCARSTIRRRRSIPRGRENICRNMNSAQCRRRRAAKPTAAQIEEIDVSTAQVTDARGIRVGMTLNEALERI